MAYTTAQAKAAVRRTAPKTETGLVLTIPKDQEHAKEQVASLVPQLVSEVTALQRSGPLTAQTFLQADALFGRIKRSRGVWATIWAEVQSRSIKPMRQALEGLYSINRDLDGPLEDAEKVLRGLMNDYNHRQMEAIRAAEEARLAEARRIQDELDRQLKLQEQARTAQMKARIQRQRETTQAQLTAVQYQDAPVKVVGSESTTRVVPKWLADLQVLMQGVLDGVVPEEAVMVNTVYLNKMFRENPTDMALWPGITIYDEVQTVKR